MKEQFKSILFQLLRKDPEGVIVTFCTGPDDLAKKMVEEVRSLIPDRRHYIVGLDGIQLEPGGTFSQYRQLRAHFRHLRIALAPVLFAGPPSPLRKAAILLAPTKILAYNQQLERHHLRPTTPMASSLFLHGVPVDRIYLRPSWFKRRRDDPGPYREIPGQDTQSPNSRPRIAVLSPYVPYPLSHGGAVRMFHLLRETAKEYQIFLFAFHDQETDEDLEVLQEFCTRIILVPKPRYREPRWSTLHPPEVHEFDSPTMHQALADLHRQYPFDLRQIEYTHLATYPGDILVEHDVTFDLYHQILKRERSVSALWNFLRWRRYELTVLPRFRRIVTMSQKDGILLAAGPGTRIIENGVDTDRFTPQPEPPGQRLLFVGSFRHFPNIEAYRFFTEKVWPQVSAGFPQLTLTVIAGPDHLLHWSQFTKTIQPPHDPRIEIRGFVSDLRPIYADSNLVIVPTTVSAGTNIKVLEAMSMGRAVLSTSSGCAGLDLKHKDSIWIADTPSDFAQAIALLISQPDLRAQLGVAARKTAARFYDWAVLGEKQRRLYRELLDTKHPAPAKMRRRRRRHMA